MVVRGVVILKRKEKEFLSIKEKMSWMIGRRELDGRKEDVAFRVEHISDEKIYFVAVDAVGKSTLKNINSFLDDYLNKMPKDLVTMMCQNEHCFGDDVVRKSKLTLLSEKMYLGANIIVNVMEQMILNLME